MSRQHALGAMLALTVVVALLPACGDPAAAARPATRPARGAASPLELPDPLPPGGRFARAEHGVGEAGRLLDSGDPAAATRALDDALLLDPMNRQARIVRGRILLAQKRPADALASFEAAREMRPDVLASEWIGLAYLALRDESLARGQGGARAGEPGPAEYAELARAAFEQVVRMDPTNSNSRHNLGYCSRLAGRVDESVQILSALVAEQPERVRSLYELGVSLQAAGRPAEARQTYERLLDIQPEHGSARRALDELGG